MNLLQINLLFASILAILCFGVVFVPQIGGPAFLASVSTPVLSIAIAGGCILGLFRKSQAFSSWVFTSTIPGAALLVFLALLYTVGEVGPFSADRSDFSSYDLDVLIFIVEVMFAPLASSTVTSFIRNWYSGEKNKGHQAKE